MVDLWFKDAVIYCLDVDSYQDFDGDGAGDFHGLVERLDHIAGLGATCLWLLPFYPSPDHDNGFDVMDYYGVDSRLGTLSDFVEFMHKAREHGLRVVIDLVVNHTSDQHPWFQSARQSRESPYRDFYVWADEPPKNEKHQVTFPGEQEDVWTFDEAAGAYYFHHFYEHQPDLNIANPAVRDEICRIMGFWLELGVSGFRVDATPFLINQPGAADALREFRKFLSWRRGDAIMLAEANVAPNQMPEYFDDGIHMMFNFWANQHLMLALVRKNATPLKEAFRDLPALPAAGQLANFLRNHDELDLGRLGDKERAEVFREFAPDEDMRIYGRGIRRRMPSMLGGDQARIRLAYSLMFSLPGTPVLRYGEEIGMGEDLSIPGRDSVRTAMQWCSATNGGFSIASPTDLLRPAIEDGEFGYRQVNVLDQSLEADSLLNWMEQLIRLRKECPEPGHGKFTILDAGSDCILAHRCDWKNGSIIAVHNFSDQSATWSPSREEEAELIELLGRQRGGRVEEGGVIELPAYGYRWFRVMGAGRKPA